MPLSKFMLNAAKLTLDAVFKASDADIRVHGVQNIPAHHVLFAVNHFTRMETAFLPYVIHKYTNQLSLSLADSSFFKGKLESILHKVGAVSTKDPQRDKILANALLSGKTSVIIFPEGQMIKDKKLIEKGKFLVYNTGIRRPPHTGAAKIAIQVEIYRQIIKKLYDKKRLEDIDMIKAIYDFKNEDMSSILTGSTYIVPVNITYYPIRARNNFIKKIVEKFTGETTGRVAEELEIEGAMLTKGVDIDINFGKALKMSDYVNKTSIIKNIFSCRQETCFGEIGDSDYISKLSIKVMQDYMDSIYKMTTVNHDHIFAYILANYPKNSISDYDFKNRASLAMERVKKLKKYSFHSTLIKRNENIGSDIFHEKYDSFMEEAVKNNLVEIKGDKIIKNMGKFALLYNFHIVRKDNFIEVLKNEIEPLTELTTLLRRIMFMTPWLVKIKIRDTFLKLDQKIFEEDYQQFYREGISKPESVGEPFFLHNIFSTKGVILIHGYMAAPKEVKLLADKIYKAGYSVYGVRLRGHGTTPEDLSGRRWQDWNESVNRGYVVMKNSVKEFAVAGFSTGAGLALLQAVQKGPKLKALVSISAPLRLQDIRASLTGAVSFFNTILKKFKIEKGKMEFVPNNPENPDINYSRNPINGTYELGKLMKHVEGNLAKVNIPALIIQATGDPVVNPQSADEIYSKISSHDKELIKIKSDRHGIVRGKELKEVADEMIAFLDRVFSK
jgi:esterase/lipase/1-acyl-sn-glycerol-3-phosphate acyltransferase